MPTTPSVELVYFTGCPHVDAARAALRTALGAARLPLAWQEWDQSAPAAPTRVQGLGSPTVLIDGLDVTGVGASSAGPACCSGGAPASDLILTALASTFLRRQIARARLS